jgi:hypothetical protein
MKVSFKEYTKDPGKYLGISAKEEVEVYDGDVRIMLLSSVSLPYAKEVLEDLELMEEDERVSLFSKIKRNYCIDCGRKTKQICHCQNDE